MDALIILVVLAPILLVSFHRHKDPAGRALVLRRTGMTLMGLTLLFMGLFVALQDPGGWAWAGAIAAAIVPLAALATIAWFRPTWAVPLLTVLTAIAVAGTAADGDFGKMQGVGAVSTVALIGAAVGATALGHQRPWAGGLMLLTLGLTPIVFGVQTVYMMPAVVYGTLYLLSDRLAKRAPTPTVEEPGPNRLRKPG